jgi:hypothetical protein
MVAILDAGRYGSISVQTNNIRVGSIEGQVIYIDNFNANIQKIDKISFVLHYFPTFALYTKHSNDFIVLAVKVM